MGRWEPDAAGRLQRAALELYAARGFDETTVAEIAERAGVTERTFFRHFADKREVLFDGSGTLEHAIVEAVEAAPASPSLLAAVARGVEAAGTLFTPERRGYAAQRRTVIDANPQLYERELVKLAALARALADALRGRGADEAAARLGADLGVAAFRLAFERWVTGDGADFAACARGAMAELEAVAGAR